MFLKVDVGCCPPPSHCEFWIQNNRNQLCSNCAIIFFNCTRPVFSITRGVVLETQPPSPLIANFGFKTTGINCAAIFSFVPNPVFNYQEGGFRNTDPPLRISGSKQHESIVLHVLQFLSLVPAPFFMTQSLEVEFCGIVLTFFLKIATLSLEIRSSFLQKIVPDPTTCELKF